MKVERSEPWDGEDFPRENPKSDDNDEIRREVPNVPAKNGVFERLGLKNGDVVLKGELLDGCWGKPLTAPARLVGRRYNGGDRIAFVNQDFEAGDCKVRCPHKYDFCGDV